jgi:hypothetical protein
VAARGAYTYFIYVFYGFHGGKGTTFGHVISTKEKIWKNFSKNVWRIEKCCIFAAANRKI